MFVCACVYALEEARGGKQRGVFCSVLGGVSNHCSEGSLSSNIESKAETGRATAPRPRQAPQTPVPCVCLVVPSSQRVRKGA